MPEAPTVSDDWSQAFTHSSWIQILCPGALVGRAKAQTPECCLFLFFLSTTPCISALSLRCFWWEVIPAPNGGAHHPGHIWHLRETATGRPYWLALVEGGGWEWESYGGPDIKPGSQ